MLLRQACSCCHGTMLVADSDTSAAWCLHWSVLLVLSRKSAMHAWLQAAPECAPPLATGLATGKVLLQVAGVSCCLMPVKGAVTTSSPHNLALKLCMMHERTPAGSQTVVDMRLQLFNSDAVSCVTVRLLLAKSGPQNDLWESSAGDVLPAHLQALANMTACTGYRHTAQ